MTNKELRQRIEASVRYGKVFPRAWFIGLVVMFCLIIVCVIIPMIVWIVNGDREAFIIMIAFFAVFGFVYILLFIFSQTIMHNLKKWVQDSVELYANVVGADPGMVLIGACFLFTYNSEEYRICAKSRAYIPAYCKRYIGKTVKILYSPKYDEVMIIRQAPSEENK